MSKEFSTVDTLAPSPPQLRVLLVDDSEVARKVEARILASCPCVQVVGEAADGEAGLAMATWLEPDLVLTDLQMPGLDGFQLVRLLRQKFPPMRLLITSAQDTPTIRASSLCAGADDFIAKERLMHELPGLLAELCPEDCPHATSNR